MSEFAYFRYNFHKKMKYLCLGLLFFLGISEAYSQVMHGQADNKKVLNFNENYFTFSQTFDLVILGKRRKMFPAPITINGRKIHSSFNTPAVKKANFGGDLSEYIFNAIKKELELLPDGNYTLRRMFLVVDKKGHLAYFDFDTLQTTSGKFTQFNSEFKTDGESPIQSVQDIIDQMGLRNAPAKASTFPKPIIPKEIKTKIYYKLYQTLKNCPKFKPAKLNGHPVDFILDDVYEMYSVENHKASLVRFATPQPNK